MRIEVPANTPMVLLQSCLDDQRLLPIYIGSPEASSIHYALEGHEPPRPLTHDLLADVIVRLGGRLKHVLISAVRDHTYYAELHVDAAGTPMVIDARPSDAIALAVRLGVAIFADDDLLDEVGQVPETESGDDTDEILDEFKDFIERVNPEDFAS